jgi:hypothetical protein
MAGWRQAVELAMTDEEIRRLAATARSRSEAARRVVRAQCCSPTVRIPRSLRWSKINILAREMVVARIKCGG